MLIHSCFSLRPIITLNWVQILSHSNSVFEFSTIEPLRMQSNENELQIGNGKSKNDTGIIGTFILINLIYSL